MIFAHLQSGCITCCSAAIKKITGPKVWRFGLGIRKKFFCERMVKHWNGLLREVIELLSLEVPKKHLNVPRDVV